MTRTKPVLLEPNTKTLYERATSRTIDYLAEAVDYARAWKWSLAERALDRAYRSVGATNPGTGCAFHCGKHPIQAEADEWGNSVIDILLGSIE